jgi:hypothetical protein
MKKIFLIIFLLLPCFVYSQDMSLDFGVVSFFIENKILEDGFISNVGFGLNYKNNLGGEIQGQFVKSAKNEKVDDSSVSDSLIANKETNYEIFLFPIQYKSTVKNNFQWKAGAGLYYEYQKSDQKGYMDMPDLETFGFARVNSYTDDFTLHLFGPLLGAGINYNTENFKMNLSGGVVPVFFLSTKEEQRMFPLFDTVPYSQKTWGSPYFYLGLESILFKYACLSVNYNYAKFEYEVIDFKFVKENEDKYKVVPIFPARNVVSQSIMFEASALIPFKSIGMGLQLGYGYMLNFYSLDSGDPVKENKQYFIISGKILTK